MPGNSRRRLSYWRREAPVYNRSAAPVAAARRLIVVRFVLVRCSSLRPSPVLRESLIKSVGSPVHPGACPERSRRVPCGSRFSMLLNRSFLSVLCVKDFFAAKQETVAILKLHHYPRAGLRAEVSKPAGGAPHAQDRRLSGGKTPPAAEKTEPACRETSAGQWGHRDRRTLLR
jgi:hypothetical protein